MKKNVFFLPLLLIAGLVGVYLYLNDSKEPVVVQGHALLPEITGEELIGQSDVIVVGRVQGLDSIKKPSVIREGSDDVVTNVTIHVSEYWRNHSDINSEYITVETLGGEVGGVTMNVQGAPVFVEGEQVLLFLQQSNEDTFTVYSWAQGKYTLDESGTGLAEESELAYFKNIFGYDFERALLKDQIESLKDVVPEEVDGETSNQLPRNLRQGGGGNNLEANDILD